MSRERGLRLIADRREFSDAIFQRWVRDIDDAVFNRVIEAFQLRFGFGSALSQFGNMSTPTLVPLLSAWIGSISSF